MPLISIFGVPGYSMKHGSLRRCLSLLLVVSLLAPGPGFAQIPGTPQSPQPPAPAAVDALDLAFWDSVKDSNRPEELQAYLKHHPNGHFAELARARLSSSEET